MVVGATQGASCFGPAYEYALTAATDLRRRKIRDRAPITFVTSEPYIGHLGFGGVGDTKGMLESILRDRDIKWITNAKVDRIAPDAVEVTEVNDDGSVKKAHKLPSKYSMFIPPFRGVDCLKGEDGKWIAGLTNPRGFVLIDKHQRNPQFRNIFAVGVCVAIPPYEPTPVPVGVPKTGFMIESMVTATAHNIARARGGQGALAPRDLECGLPRRFRRQRRRLRRAAADSAAQRQLVEPGLLGAHGQGCVRAIFPAQGPQRFERARLRALRDEDARRQPPAHARAGIVKEVGVCADRDPPPAPHISPTRCATASQCAT